MSKRTNARIPSSLISGIAMLTLASTPVHAFDVGSAAPPFSLSSNRGKLDSASLKGKLVYSARGPGWAASER